MKENLYFNPKYSSLKEGIVSFIQNFDTEGEPFGNGNRNTIKVKEIEGITVNVKSFKIPHLLNQFAYKYIRKSKAKRSFENANFLIANGFGTPEPIAYFEYFNGVGLQKSFYVSVHLKCDLTFRELISNTTYPEREIIIKEFTKFTYLLHEKGILFKDHSPGNTLIKKINNTYGFYLVDLNRMDFKTLTFEERIRNFARLTPKKEMVEIMSAEYALLTGENFSKVLDLMWKETEAFQAKFQRKKRLKKKFLFGN